MNCAGIIKPMMEDELCWHNKANDLEDEMCLLQHFDGHGVVTATAGLIGLE